HPVQVLERFIQAVLDVVGDAALLLSCGLEHGIRCYASNEMTPQIIAKIGKAFVAHRLDRPDHRCRVYVVALRKFPGRKKASFFAIVEYVTNQLLPVWPQPRSGLGEPRLERGRCPSSIAGWIAQLLFVRRRLAHSPLSVRGWI